MNWTVTLLLGALLGPPVVSLADPGPVTLRSSNSLNELTFTCTAAVVKVEFVDANVVRVRMEPQVVGAARAKSAHRCALLDAHRAL